MLRALLGSSSRSAPPLPPPPPPPPPQQQQQRVMPVLILVPTTTSASTSSTSAAAASSWQPHGALSRLLCSTEVGISGSRWGSLPPPPPAPAVMDSHHPDGKELPVTLQSFGERTAAAKEMISAAPGGPVRGFSRSISLPAPSSFNVTQRFPASSLPKRPQSGMPLFEKKKRNGKKRICVFCKKNGESASTYESHGLSFHNGKETIISCPILRKLRCEMCGATGDQAHTRTHCPLNSKSDDVPVAVILKQTRRKCNGSLREF
ncbi:Nanos-like protein 2 [Frankliniella fusca]|uniref:Nanos-like protein 2 n=1 Tax=Frankliniella fusca TaxID=407009 RepID=A0AAE1HH13_9NEOP|nr:Nanos-like protein 2 [Frankliniella fusca]